MKASDIASHAVGIAWEALQTLALSLTPWAMEEFCARCGVESLDLEAWSATVHQLRNDISSDSVSYAERAARVTHAFDFLAETVQSGLEVDSAEALFTWLRPVLAHVLIAKLAASPRDAFEDALVVASVLLLLTDIRVRESVMGTSTVYRTEQAIWSQLKHYASDERFSVAALACAVLAAPYAPFLRFLPSPSTLFTGFDIPIAETSNGVLAAPLETAREAARWAFAAEYRRDTIELLPGTHYGAFAPPTPVVPAFATGFRIAIVPVPPSSRFDPADTSRPPMLHISVGGDIAPEARSVGDGTLSYSISGDAGILVPAPPFTDWDRGLSNGAVEVTGAVEATIQYATAQRARTAADPDGVSLTVDRFVVEGRISAAAGVGSGTGGALGVVSARVDLEGATLTIGRVPGLSWLLSGGISVTFNVGAMATLPLGGSLEFGFRGAAGGELVIPMGQRSMNGCRIDQIRVKAHTGRTGDSADAPNRMVLDVLADLSVGVGVLMISADGAGVRLSAGTTDEPDGNVAGVTHVGWEAVYPTRMSVAIDDAGGHGAGFVDYDAAERRATGGGEFFFGRDWCLRVLFLSEPSLTGSGRSWLVLGTGEFSLGWLKGAGFLYADKRTTNPTALLAAVAAGDLEAILFPADIATRGAAYIATLGRLFPASTVDSWVAGLFLAFSWLGGKVRADVGVMYDAGASERAYLLARLRITMPTLDDPLTKIEIAALGVWDRARDEYELRAALINSHIFGGELTGEALMFSGRVNPADRNSGRVFLVSIGGFHPKYVVPGPAIQVPARVSLLVQRGDHLRLECQAYLAITQGTLQLGLESSLVARFAGFGIRGNLGFDALINTSLEFLVSVRVGVALYLGSRMLLGASLEGEIGLVGEGNAAQAYLRGRARISFWFFDYETPRFTIPLILIRREWSMSNDPEDRLYDAIMENSNWDNGGTLGVLVQPSENRSDWRVSPSAPLRFTQALVPLDVPITHFESVALPQARTLAIEVDRPVGATWTTSAVEEEFAPMMFFSMTPEEKLAVRGFEYLPGGVELARPLTAGVAIDLGLECEELVIDRSNPPEAPRSIMIESEIAVLGQSLGPHRSIFQQGPSRQPASLREEQFAVLDARGDVVAIDRSFTAAFGHARGQLGHEVVPMREVA